MSGLWGSCWAEVVAVEGGFQRVVWDLYGGVWMASVLEECGFMEFILK